MVELGRVRRPTQDRERPQAAGKPGIERIGIAPQFDAAVALARDALRCLLGRRDDHGHDAEHQDLGRIAALGFAVPVQHIDLVRHLGGPGGEQVAGVGVAGDELERLAFP